MGKKKTREIFKSIIEKDERKERLIFRLTIALGIIAIIVLLATKNKVEVNKCIEQGNTKEYCLKVEE